MWPPNSSIPTIWPKKRNSMNGSIIAQTIQILRIWKGSICCIVRRCVIRFWGSMNCRWRRIWSIRKACRLMIGLIWMWPCLECLCSLPLTTGDRYYHIWRKFLSGYSFSVKLKPKYPDPSSANTTIRIPTLGSTTCYPMPSLNYPLAPSSKGSPPPNSKKCYPKLASDSTNPIKWFSVTSMWAFSFLELLWLVVTRKIWTQGPLPNWLPSKWPAIFWVLRRLMRECLVILIIGTWWGQGVR